MIKVNYEVIGHGKSFNQKNHSSDGDQKTIIKRLHIWLLMVGLTNFNKYRTGQNGEEN